MFISNAWADAASKTANPSLSDSLLSMLPLAVIFALFWFMIIRPQMQRSKEQGKLVAGLQKGDEILTTGGLAGRIVKVGEQFVTIEVASGMQIHVQKTAVQSALPKGTLKEL